MTGRTRSSRSLVAALVLALIGSWLFFGFGGGAVADTGSPTATTSKRPPVVVSQVLFINLQSGREDLHRVNMAFQMARGQHQLGRPVTIFFNINAPELATKNLPAALRWRDNAPIKDQVTELIASGVKVLVCPSCSADQGVTATDLVPGAQMSNPVLTGSQIQPGTVSMSY